MSKISLGKVLKPQGIKGELKIKPVDNNTEIFKNITYVMFNNSANKHKVVSLVYRLGYFYLKIEGLEDRTNAEKYRNFKVFVNREDITIQKDAFFTDDLIGLDVFDENDNYVGTLLDIENYGSADIFSILEDKREYKIPFLTSIVINVGKEKITVDSKKYNEAKICE